LLGEKKFFSGVLKSGKWGREGRRLGALYRLTVRTQGLSGCLFRKGGREGSQGELDEGWVREKKEDWGGRGGGNGLLAVALS